MEFLIPHMTNRRQHSNLSPAAEKESANAVAEDMEFELNSTFDSSPATPKVEKKSILTFLQKQELQRSERHDKRLKERQELLKPNPLRDFFASMHGTVEKFPPEVQLQVKRKIFAIVSEAEQSVLEQNCSDSSFVNF